MNKNLQFGLIFTVSMAFGSANAGDVKNGKKLYEANCTGCHDTSVHTRSDRLVRNYSALVNRVKACDAQMKAGMTGAQLSDVIDYLNAEFYKFGKK
jgi:mono/diheme cytochrome c family protein